MIELQPLAARLRAGRLVRCSDGPAGRLADVVMDPDEGCATHVVVERRSGEAHLVPVTLLAPQRPRNVVIGLSCTRGDVAACEAVRPFAYVQADFPHVTTIATVDGREIGRLDGFLAADGRTTHVVFRGSPAAAIPIDAVETIETDRVTVRLSKRPVGAVRGVRLHWLPIA